MRAFNPLNPNPTKWSNTLKRFVGNLLTNYLSVFDHFVKLALKWVTYGRLIQVVSGEFATFIHAQNMKIEYYADIFLCV